MRDAKEIVTDVLGLEGDLSAGRNGFEVYCAERDSAIVELECDRADAYAFALALALLAWLHGSQAPDARAELDAWMRAGISVTGAKGDDGRARVRPAEEGEHVIGETMTDGIGLQYVKTWPTFIDEVGDFRPFTPEESAILDAQTGPAFVRPFVASTGPMGNWPKAKP